MSKDNVLNAMEQTKRKRVLFFDAWKRGVAYLGPELFGPGTLATAKDKNDLQPLPQAVEAIFASESGGVKQFIAAMVSFMIRSGVKNWWIVSTASSQSAA
ncbi:MAG: hypothetical protein SCI25_15515 [Desulfuromonadales bacterium]|nr:hypothetical protein [Desulfuromonadales bacterium]MDW7758438.1 hypothetical protein [Desulfuromonadales bacterium]